MTKIDDAVSRVDAALARLEQAIDARVEAAATAPAEDAGDREKLEKEVEILRARAAEDARLRAEAAGAVREALRDLRGAVARRTDDEGERANA